MYWSTNTKCQSRALDTYEMSRIAEKHLTDNILNKQTTVHAAILSGGSGSRFQSVLPKQFVKLAGKTIIEHTISAFDENPHVDEIIIVSSADFRHLIDEIVSTNEYSTKLTIVPGGDSRMESCLSAVEAVPNDNDVLIIHDGARPLVSQKTISDCIKTAIEHNVSGVVTPCTDAVFETINDQYISRIFERDKLRLGTSPQAFRIGLIKEGLKIAEEKQHDHFLDYCGMIKEYELSNIYLVNGNTENIKVTFPEDLYIAETLLLMRSIGDSTVDLQDLKDKNIVLLGEASEVEESITKQSKQYGANVFSFSSTNGFDISKPQSVKDAMRAATSQAGDIDYIICTTAISRTGKLTDRTIEDLEKEVTINYFGTIHAIKYSTPYLVKTKGSFALFAPNSFTKTQVSHSPINAAIFNLIQSEAEKLMSDDVRMNAINHVIRELQPEVKNVGKEEAKEAIVSSEKIAIETLKMLLSTRTGQVINVN